LKDSGSVIFNIDNWYGKICYNQNPLLVFSEMIPSLSILSSMISWSSIGYTSDIVIKINR
jgi:hypothetical protein